MFIFAAMQTTLCSQWDGSSELDITCNLNVVIAFEDVAAGKHAQRFYEYLTQRLGADFEFTRYQWNFSLLKDPNVREVAARDAVTADIVIIATHGDADLPEHFRSWIKMWVGRNANPMALVALFDRRVECDITRMLVRSYLNDVARIGGMEFFTEPDNSPNFDPACLERLVEIGARATA